MPVTLYCNQLFHTPRNLYQFLSSCQQISVEKNTSQIVSISLGIAAIDPLVVLHEIAQSEQLSFYFEKQDAIAESVFKMSGGAIAAIDAVAQLQVEGRDRFSQVKAFIKSTLADTIVAGETDLPFSGPHFFCSFAFADHSHHHGSPDFPAATVFLPRWQVSCSENGCVIVANLLLDPATALERTVDTLWQNMQTIRSLQDALISPTIQQTEFLQHQDLTPTETFKQAVQFALESIQAQQFNKIVLAHAVEMISPLAFNPVSSLNNLRQLYPDCYVFSACNGLGQYFLGASPERLVCLQNHLLVTDALAGTAPRGKTMRDDARLASSLLTNPKEMHEHQVVIDFLTHQLTQLGLSPERFPLRLRQLPNIQHLHTPIRALVPSQVHLLDVVAALHPTPAVAGLPREITCAQIDRLEPFARSLYAGPIGWVNYKGDGEFAVGIRSALVEGGRARLFAGAGIVQGSDPERELAEVQLKLQVLRAALV
ncbi:MAG: isochorismate synthase [Leptolyngbyaceae cyanobacterium]